MQDQEKLEDLLKNAVKSYENFPKPGVTFYDVFGIFSNVNALEALKELLIKHVSLHMHMYGIDGIVGLDARGFLLGPLIAIEIGKPFSPIRKKGKLPGKTVSCSYDLEYGSDTFEIQTDNFSEGKRILVVDDLLATGGSMETAVKLINSTGARVMECLVVIELTGLKGRERIGTPVHSLVQFD